MQTVKTNELFSPAALASQVILPTGPAGTFYIKLDLLERKRWQKVLDSDFLYSFDQVSKSW